MITHNNHKSVAIDSVSYDSKTLSLYVTFTSGKTYAFYNVPGWVWLNFPAGKGAGAFFVYYVRNNFRFRKVKNVPKTSL